MARLQVNRWLLVPLALLALVVGGCAGKSTPPGADIAYGSVEGAGYTLMRWQEGLALMVWQRGTDSLMCEGGGSTRDPVYELNCQAESEDGYRLDWTVQSTDGETAQLEMGNETYALSGGTLMLVTASDAGLAVIQLDRDLSGIPFDHNQITAFALSDPDIAEFIRSLSTE
jgi:hypothetical protein